jgi:hypothetical protein
MQPPCECEVGTHPGCRPPLLHSVHTRCYPGCSAAPFERFGIRGAVCVTVRTPTGSQRPRAARRSLPILPRRPAHMMTRVRFSPLRAPPQQRSVSIPRPPVLRTLREGSVCMPRRCPPVAATDRARRRECHRGRHSCACQLHPHRALCSCGRSDRVADGVSCRECRGDALHRPPPLHPPLCRCAVGRSPRCGVAERVMSHQSARWVRRRWESVSVWWVRRRTMVGCIIRLRGIAVRASGPISHKRRARHQRCTSTIGASCSGYTHRQGAPSCYRR